MSSDKTRVFLWAVPRSISTAFFRAMMNRKSVKVLLEPYSRPYYFGPERVSARYAKENSLEGCTFMDIKQLCEQPFEEESIFVKDMAYYLVNRLDTIQYLPEGYKHTFIVRDPKKTVYSLYKMSLNKDLTGWDHFDQSEVGFKELHQMYKLVTEVLGQEAVVVDADDLIQHPEDILRQYCRRMGLEFEDGMLNWDETPKNMEIFKDWMPWFEGVLTSKSFEPSATKPKSPQVMPELPAYVRKAIEENEYYYKIFHSVRLLPNTLTL